MKEEKISIIVPVYNVKEYLERCVNSIVNQTYKNLEIILVDDGSTDGSGKICDKLAKTDKRIKVIHKSNGGLSDARNAGIEKSTGKYLGFVDSDDYINCNMYECLYNCLKKNDADISICDFLKTMKSDEDIHKKDDGEDFVFSKREAYYKLYENYYSLRFVVAWNKLYKKELFKDIKYPINKYNEDEAVIHYLYDNASKIAYTSQKYYYYYQRDNSIMNSKGDLRPDALECFKERGEFFKKKRLYRLVDYNNYIICYQLSNMYLRTNDKIKKKTYKDDIKYYSRLVANSKYNTKIQKIVTKIIKICPSLLHLLSFINQKIIIKHY